MHHNYAFEYIDISMVMAASKKFHVLIEDPAQRAWYGKDAAAKQQGAGAIKMLVSLWREWAKSFDEDDRVSVDFIHPIIGGTKWGAKKFKLYSEWSQRTNEHSRDAAVIALYYPTKKIKLPNLADSVLNSMPI